MGTSASFGGQGRGTPLLPSWVDDLGAPTAAGPSLQDEGNTDRPEAGDTHSPRPTIQQPAEADRFRAARRSFSRFVSSGGSDRRALGRALRGHVRSASGGSRGATQRMGASARSATNLLTVLHNFRDQGVERTLRSLSLEGLSGRSPKEILLALTDVVCAPGGPIDEAIARDAFVEAVVNQDLGENLGELSDGQIQALVIEFIGRSIIDRILNDVGNRIDVLALSSDQVEHLNRTLEDFVLGAISERLHVEISQTQTLSGQQLTTAINGVYGIAFEIIELEANALI